ncbi:MAG: HEAT repeat domain-containing protein [Endomicrobiales bacterium]
MAKRYIVAAALVLFVLGKTSLAGREGEKPAAGAAPVVAASTGTPKPDLRTNLEKLSDPAPLVRRNAVIFLGAEKKKGNVTALLRMLADDNAEVRRAAANALASAGDLRAVAPLIEKFNAEKNLGVKMNIVVALGDLRSASSLGLLTSLLEDPYPPFRSEALRALGKIDSKESYPVIVARLEDEAEGVRVMAAEVSGRLKLPSSVPQLLKNLAHPVPVVRRSSAQALGEVGDETALPDLEKTLQDADASVAAAGKDALAAVTKRLREKAAAVEAAEKSAAGATAP